MARVIVFFVLIVTAFIFTADNVIADEFCNLELVDVWKCPYLSSASIWSTGLAVNDGYIYFPGRDHIYILEASDSGTLSLNSTQIDLAIDHLGDIVVRNNLAYIANANQLLIYDVSDPLDFDSLSSCRINYINQIDLMDTLLIASAGDIHVINIADSTNPVYVKEFSTPWDDVFLPVVDQENYPYVLVPCMLEIEPGPYGYWDSYINVIDITQSYSYSPHLNDWNPDSYGEDISALIKTNDLYIGCTATPDITIFQMDSIFNYTIAKTGYNISSFDLHPTFLQAINDSIVYCSVVDQFCLLNIADTSSIEVIARFKNTDGDRSTYWEAFYDVALQDSFLFVFASLGGTMHSDTMAVFSFKIDLDFSIQCGFNDKPNELELETYPNPFNGKCNIKYSMVEQYSPVDVDIYNIKGKHIDSYTNLPPQNILKWDASRYPTGIYLIRVSNTIESIDSKIIYIG